MVQVHKSALPVAILNKSAIGCWIFGLLDALTLLGQVVAAQTRACARAHTRMHTLAHTGFIQVYLLLGTSPAYVAHKCMARMTGRRMAYRGVLCLHIQWSAFPEC